MNNLYDENWGTRLELVKKALSLKTQAGLAEIFGVSQATVSRYEKGQTALPDEMKLILSEKGINLHWLLTGKGDMFISGKSEIYSENKIPILNQKASAGLGQDWMAENNIERYVEPLDLLPGLAQAHPHAFRVQGVSMLGAGIRNGDIVLFDSRQNQKTPDDIYVFALDGEVYVKMLSFESLTSVTSIFSVPVSIDKPELLTKIENDPANSDRFHIFGRVLALLRGNNVIQHKF